MSPLLALLPRIGYLRHFGIKIQIFIVSWYCQKNMNMVEMFLKSPTVYQVDNKKIITFQSTLPAAIRQISKLKSPCSIILTSIQKKCKGPFRASTIQSKAHFQPKDHSIDTYLNNDLYLNFGRQLARIQKVTKQEWLFQILEGLLDPTRGQLFKQLENDQVYFCLKLNA